MSKVALGEQGEDKGKGGKDWLSACICQTLAFSHLFLKIACCLIFSSLLLLNPLANICRPGTVHIHFVVHLGSSALRAPPPFFLFYLAYFSLPFRTTPRHSPFIERLIVELPPPAPNPFVTLLPEWSF